MVPGGHRFRLVSVGDGYLCGVTTTHEAYCWGSNATPNLTSARTADYPASLSGALRVPWWGKLVAQFNSQIRLVRLRPEFASLYPGLDPGVWETATELAEHTIQPSPGFMLSNRILPDEHFEFRGGTPGRGSSWSGMRSRVTDRSNPL